MKLRKKILFIFIILITLSIVISFTKTNVSAATNQFKGVNWADPRDNFNTGVIYLTGLNSSDTYSSASAKADKIVGDFVTKLGTNSVRMPINEPTVTNYWNTYTGAIDKALTKGKVILCYWAPTHGDGPKDMNKFWSMWSTVVTKYADNSNCYFEVFNEPHMYSASDLCNLYFNFITKFPNVSQNRVILDGAGLAQNIPAIGNDKRLSKCLLAVHDYTMFVNPTNMNENDWARHIQGSVGAYADRTICTEWGAPMSPGSKNGVHYDTQNYNNPVGSYFVPYVRGISNQLRRWNMGSFYWAGLKDGDWYSMTKMTGSGTNISLTVSNQSGLDWLKNSWGSSSNTNTNTDAIPGNNAKLTDGWYYIKNVNAQKYLQVTNGIAKNCQNIELRTLSGAVSQKWYLKNLNNGYVTLKSALGEFMVDINGEENRDGANVQIYTAHSGDAQQFMIKTTPINGSYIIATKCSNLTKVLDDSANNTADGTNVLQWTYGGKANQQWIFEPVTNSGSVTPSTPAPDASAKLKLDYTINRWDSGYGVTFKITNSTSSDINNWTLKIKKSCIKINSSYNINLKEDNDYYIITPESWNSSIAKENSIEFGVQGSGTIASTLDYTLS